MIRISRSIVPNFFTVGNMLSGFMSIIFAVQNKDFVLASWMILLAGFLDAIDGKVARITNSSSKFGVEYDSLADVVSFGVAPSLIIYEYFLHSWSMVGMLISFFPLLFGSIRLARFNVQVTGFSKSHFNGLPIPGSAIAIASYILFMDYFFDGTVLPRFILALVFIVSVLMVSNVRYEVITNFSMNGGGKQKLILTGLVIFALLVIVYPQALIFPVMLVYIISGMVKSALIKTNERRPKNYRKRKPRTDNQGKSHQAVPDKNKEL